MEKIRSKFSKNGIYTILIIALIIGISNSANIKNVYLDIFTGNAKKQAKENKWIINYLENSEKQELSIPQVKQRSKILYSFTVPTKPKGWGHWVVTKYFDKKTVVVDKSQSIEEFMTLNSGNFKEKNMKVKIKDN